MSQTGYVLAVSRKVLLSCHCRRPMGAMARASHLLLAVVRSIHQLTDSKVWNGKLEYTNIMHGSLNYLLDHSSLFVYRKVKSRGITSENVMQGRDLVRVKTSGQELSWFHIPAFAEMLCSFGNSCPNVELCMRISNCL